MANEIKNMLSAIAVVAKTASGDIRKSTSLPPEQMPPDPFVIVMLVGSRIEVGPTGTMLSLSDVAVDIFKDRHDLARDLGILQPYLDSIPMALLGEITGSGGRFANTMQTFGTIQTTFLPGIIYSNVDVIGYRFVMKDCKILVNL